MRNLAAHFIALIAVLPAISSAVDFNREIRPILSDKCFACHGPDEHERKADLRLDTKEGAFGDLGGYFAIVPGKPESSEVWLRIMEDDPDEIMPPPKFHKELTPEEKKLIEEWIKEGAEFKMHWSFAGLERPEVPAVEGDFVKNEVDQFILAGLKEQGLTPSAQADKATLIRRLFLDLLGLPPSPEAVDAFVKDDSPDAYANLVQQLLENPAYGERMAVYWLDLVRYADTIGYHSDTTMEVSAYRDYVIDSFNRNQPYDQFTIEQLAGDLLEEPTLEQRVASGYNRLLQTTEEGGAQPEEYLVIHAADRVRNVSGVWLGATIGCAQCHDHKFDPFTQKDHYAMAAFFADIKEKAIGKRQPNLKLPSAEEEAKLAELQQNLAENTVAKLLERNSELSAKILAAQQNWEAETLAKLDTDTDDWTVLKPAKLESSGKAALKVQPDNSVLATGPNPAKDNYSIHLDHKGRATGFRLEAMTHDSLKNKSLSRGNGNFVLTNVRVSLGGEEVKIASATADFEQATYPIANAFDGKSNTGWAVDGHNKAENRVAMFLFETPVEVADGQQLLVELQHQSGFGQHNIGRFRISLTDSKTPTLSGGVNLAANLLEVIKIAAADRKPAQQKLLDDHFRGIAPELDEARKNLVDWKAEMDALNKQIQTMLVSEPIAQPRMTRILNRGDWLDKDGEVVEPAVPVFLPHEHIEDRRATRLDLANWIVSDTNPLTSRAFANRLWKLLFGRGISRNLDDLGGQGEPPTHPELLDWLAVEFRESGWDVQHMIKILVMSGAYQQTSSETPELRGKDAGNLWYARQGRWRIDAEFVRDTALEIADLLVVEEPGGKSVKPYQPAGYWQHLNFPTRKWQAGKEDDLYRRGLYTFWCRSFLHPAMLAFDAPSREECTAERARSNIPQQALVLLNDPVFVEAARVFAQSTADQPGAPAAKLAWAWKKALGRELLADEAAILTDVYETQLNRYTADAESAQQLLNIGDHPLKEGVNAAELAAWTQVTRTILNAYETTSRY